MPSTKTSKTPPEIQESPKLDPAAVAKVVELRSKAHELFGRVVMSMAQSPRHRHLSLLDTQTMVLDPLIRDRLAFAQQKGADGKPDEMAPLGIAFWASVSEEVDQRIQEQMKAGIFPIRLKPDDWTSGKIHWLLDVVAPNQQLAAGTIANFRQMAGDGVIRIHSFVAQMVPPDVLQAMGIGPVSRDGSNT